VARERTENERIEVGGAPTPPPLAPDPTGDRDVFAATGVMPFEAPFADIYNYVSIRAEMVGVHIKRNRGGSQTIGSSTTSFPRTARAAATTSRWWNPTGRLSRPSTPTC